MAALVTRSNRLAVVQLAEKQEKGQRGLNKLAAKLRRQAIAAAASVAGTAREVWRAPAPYPWG